LTAGSPFTACATWKAPSATVVLNLNNLLSVDDAGVAALRLMIERGINCGGHLPTSRYCCT
jgi:hypothetical protein